VNGAVYLNREGERTSSDSGTEIGQSESNRQTFEAFLARWESFPEAALLFQLSRSANAALGNLGFVRNVETRTTDSMPVESSGWP
jgi:hypothetical protein